MMKNIKSNFILKFIAVILVSISVTAMLFSSLCFVFGTQHGAFLDGKRQKDGKTELYRQQLVRITSNIANNFEFNDRNDKNPWFYRDYTENVMFEISNENGEVIYSTVDDSKYQLKDGYEREYYFGPIFEEEEVTYTDPYTDEYGIERTEVITKTESKVVEEGKYVSYYVTTYLKENITEHDLFYVVGEFFDFVAREKSSIEITFIVSFIVNIIAFVFLMCAAGHKKGEEDIHISRFDKFPLDILTVIFGGGIVGLAYIICVIQDSVLYRGMSYTLLNILSIYKLAFVVCALCVFTAVFLLTILAMTIAVRFKTKTVIKSTILYKVIYKIFKFCYNGMKSLCKFIIHSLKTLPLVWKTILITAVIGIIFFVCFAGAYESEIFIVFGMLFTMACCGALILVSIVLKDIQKGTKEVVNGNTAKKIDTKYMIGDIKDHAENINSINDGIAKAVEQRMKSERFKTELITNVSHDIKTPLTSIINYVDLLEKEDIDNEKAQEYIEVLSRQSTRLKKLIEDLIEASKASTGNLAVHTTKFEIGILLSQALGEYEEKFKNSDLDVVLTKPDGDISVTADSRHVWRIFDNVFNNIVKYAMPHTRVYIDVTENNGNVEIQFKNISREQLNITGEELMERFVRGDSSRNTEGSGLGLSIAKNLAHLQHGAFNIQIDGDLFKVNFTLPLSK